MMGDVHCHKSAGRKLSSARRHPVTVERGGDFRVVHASISTTLNIYTHVVDASHRQAVEDVEQRLFGDLDPNGPKLRGSLETAIAASSSVT